jgi:hypothetical protein
MPKWYGLQGLIIIIIIIATSAVSADGCCSLGGVGLMCMLHLFEVICIWAAFASRAGTQLQTWVL